MACARIISAILWSGLWISLSIATGDSPSGVLSFLAGFAALAGFGWITAFFIGGIARGLVRHLAARSKDSDPAPRLFTIPALVFLLGLGMWIPWLGWLSLVAAFLFALPTVPLLLAARSEFPRTNA